jgi:uncharacterized membrane-anchored protein
MKIHGWFAGWSLLVLIALNGAVVQKEVLLKSGQMLLLRLAPRDPRSIMQGDYMVINYEQPPTRTDRFAQAEEDPFPYRGSVAFRPDARGVGSFTRYLPPGAALEPGEIRVNYRKASRQRWGRSDLLFAADSFLFQEGRSNDFDQARFGELRVAPSGECLLVNLRKENLEPIGKPVH